MRLSYYEDSINFPTMYLVNFYYHETKNSHLFNLFGYLILILVTKPIVYNTYH